VACTAHAGAALAQDSTAQKEKRIPLRQALETIEKKWHTKFAYEHNLLAGKFTTTRALQGATAEEVLKNVLYPNNLLFLYVSDNAYSIVARDARFFQAAPSSTEPGNPDIQGPGAPSGPATHTLRGLVIDDKGTAMPFVNVWVKGTRRGAQTDDRGEFILNDLLPTDTMVFSFVGYRTESIPVLRQASVTVQLYTTGKSTLDEVTVVSTGLQQLPKERATGSFATISGKTLEKIPSPNVLQRMEGQVPGVKISIMAGDRSFIYGGAGNQVSINGGTRTVGTVDYDVNIRGKSTLQAETFPLIVVDGAITDLDISALNPDDVENITYLKDAAAASIWGVRAANGVIVINTKKGHTTPTPTINFSANASIAERPNLGYLKRMNSAQQLGYEAELVKRGFINSLNLNSSSYSYATLYPNPGAVLALQLQAGTITQAQYNASVDSLSTIDNTGQIQKYLLHPATNQEYNLSVSGGNSNSSYYYSASYSKEDPNTKRTVGQRLTLTLNNSWKLFKVATLSTSLRGAFFQYYNNGMSLTGLFPTNSASMLMPYMQLMNGNGKSVSYDRINPAFTSTLPSAFTNWQYNYLDELNNNDNVQKDNIYSANINLSIPLYKGLSGSVQYSNERTFSNTRDFYDPATWYYRNTVNTYTSPSTTTGINGLGITSGGILSLVNTALNNYAVRGQLSYDATLSRIHQINAIAGSEIRETNTGQGGYTLYGYNTSTGLSNAVSFLPSGYPSIYGYPTGIAGAPYQQDKRRRYLSYFSNAAYTLLEKYSLSASVRYDDYNNFGLDRKYRATPLWSGGMKWNMARENFMRRFTWIDNLALRTTYGINGNISTTMYPFTAISLGSNDYTTGLPTASIINLANPELKWEKTYVTNLGLDYSLWNSRLSGSIEYYYKKGKDLLYSFPINAAYAGNIGNGYLTRNAASMTGKGVDLSLNGVILATKTFSWNMGLTFSYNTNKLTDNRFDTSTISSYYTSYLPIGNLVGYPTDKLLVFRNAGLDANGMTRVFDRKHDTVSVTQPLLFSDLKYAGRTTAPYFGGWNTTFRYGHFSLYALMTWQFGGVFLKPSISSYMTAWYRPVYSVSGDIAKRWQQAGDETKTNVPGLNGTGTQVTYSLSRYQYSDINVLSSDYIRLREVSLSYEFPTAWISKWQAKGASLGVAVRNLGLIWRANKQGYDPDFTGYPNSSYSLPASRSYNFSFKLTF
jgi:TonB-linked SusC/RagA family outer membrane protein